MFAAPTWADEKLPCIPKLSASAALLQLQQLLSRWIEQIKLGLE